MTGVSDGRKEWPAGSKKVNFRSDATRVLPAAAPARPRPGTSAQRGQRLAKSHRSRKRVAGRDTVIGCANSHALS